MDPSEVTIEILKDIRNETRKTNERVDVVGGEVQALRGEMRELRFELVDRIERVERRQTETELRIATELVGVAGAVREVRDLLREDRAMRVRLDDHERRITAIEAGRG